MNRFARDLSATQDDIAAIILPKKRTPTYQERVGLHQQRTAFLADDTPFSQDSMVTKIRNLMTVLSMLVLAQCVHATQAEPRQEPNASKPKSQTKADKQANKDRGETSKEKQDAKHTMLNAGQLPSSNEDFSPFGIYEKTAPLPAQVEPLATELPLQILASDRIVLIGNTLLERSQEFGRFEAFPQQKFTKHNLTVRHLAWSVDTIELQPRPDNFASTSQHMTHVSNL